MYTTTRVIAQAIGDSIEEMASNVDDDSSVESSMGGEYEQPLDLNENANAVKRLSRSCEKRGSISESSIESGLSSISDFSLDDLEDYLEGDLENAQMTKDATISCLQVSPSTTAPDAESKRFSPPSRSTNADPSTFSTPRVRASAHAHNSLMSPCGRLVKKGRVSSPEVSPHFLQAQRKVNIMRNRTSGSRRSSRKEESPTTELSDRLHMLQVGCPLDDSTRK